MNTENYYPITPRCNARRAWLGAHDTGGDPMTLSELLEELKAADPDTWDVVVRGIPLKPFCQYFTFDRCGQRAHQYPDVYLGRAYSKA